MTSNNSKPIFLDVDSSIVEKNLRFTRDDEEDEFTKLFGKAPPPSKIITPTPGLVVKTHEVGTSKKVFVNICHTDAIPPPKNITEQELQKQLEDEVPDFKVPMSIGNMRADKDNKGVEVNVVDIAIHTTFFKKMQNIATFKSFFFAVAFAGLEHKYGLICVDQKIILKNKAAYGTLQPHRIEQRDIEEKMGKEAPKPSPMEEITGKKEEPKKKVIIETLSSVENKPRVPEYRLYKQMGGPNSLIGEFKFPDVISAKQLTVDIGEDRILVESTSKNYLLDIFIPYVIRQENCTSTFIKASKILRVVMPLKGG
ncbi:PIH1 domain-containing protein 1 [Aethina tumida]|uniref:PIH1 domain-containing protein 1 n=1 Tax=Aethina tumida TaxID=116153 RepID=UPI0021483E34|nr:PIH1 domain-containing protein 1 [Aethina tumida]